MRKWKSKTAIERGGSPKGRISRREPSQKASILCFDLGKVSENRRHRIEESLKEGGIEDQGTRDLWLGYGLQFLFSVGGA